jgi:hypothetical protein
VPDNFSEATEIEDPFYRVEEVSVRLFGPGLPSMTTDLEDLPDGVYRLCVAASAPNDPGTLIASTEHGALFEIDPWTAEATPLGILPAYPSDIAHDPASKESLLGIGLRLLQSFDWRDGLPTAAPVLVERTYGGLEFGPSGLLAATTYYYDFWPPGPGIHYWSTLYHVNVSEGSDEEIRSIGLKNVHALAYDGHEGVLRALGNYLFAIGIAGGPSTLMEVDLQTAEISIVGSTSEEVRGFATGPDGLLYSLGASDGVLYRIDAETARTSPVGPTGLMLPAAMMRTGAQGSLDCVEFSKQGESVLAVNASCGPPTAVAAASTMTAECTSPDGGPIVLDGSASSDPNSTAGTNDALAAFEWFLDLGLPGEVSLGRDAVLPVVLPLGDHRITLQVTNIFGESATDEIRVEVVDTSPPSIDVVLTPDLLWPPDHHMVVVTAEVAATDACGGAVIHLRSVASNEPDDARGAGDGSTTGDVRHAEPGTADLEFELRAERSARGTGRVYTVTYSATDGSGNESTAEATVVVPHDRGQRGR